MKRAVKQIALSALLLILFCIACRLFLFNDFELLPAGDLQDQRFSDHELSYRMDKDSVFRPENAVVQDGYLHIKVKPMDRGSGFLSVQLPGGREETHFLRVGVFNTVFDMNTGSFTGDSAVLIASSAFFILISVIMVWNFRSARGSEFYSYITVYFAGFSVFSSVTGILLIYITVLHMTWPYKHTMFDAVSVLCRASSHFMMLTLPLVCLFSIAMIISNIALIRHEGYAHKNTLGLLLASLMIAGDILGLYLFSKNLSGSYKEVKLIGILQNTYATIYVYFECMLVGAAVCALKATRLQPEYNKDFIVILGCRIRKDGTLPPLLRGRADRALAFWLRQKSLTSKQAGFIPSGGKGNDESISEAEAVARYLRRKGIPDELVHIENKSTSTYENMLYSKHVIDDLTPGAKAVFATNNYHLFRSGVAANRAGLKAESIGCRTRWWFWPNAFVRECASLLLDRWKEELILLTLIILFFSLIATVIG